MSKPTALISSLEPVLEKIASYLIELPTAPYSHRCYTLEDIKYIIDLSKTTARPCASFAQMSTWPHAITQEKLQIAKTKYNALNDALVVAIAKKMSYDGRALYERMLTKYDEMGPESRTITLQTLLALDA